MYSWMELGQEQCGWSGACASESTDHKAHFLYNSCLSSSFVFSFSSSCCYILGLCHVSWRHTIYNDRRTGGILPDTPRLRAIRAIVHGWTSNVDSSIVLEWCHRRRWDIFQSTGCRWPEDSTQNGSYRPFSQCPERGTGWNGWSIGTWSSTGHSRTKVCCQFMVTSKRPYASGRNGMLLKKQTSIRGKK